MYVSFFDQYEARPGRIMQWTPSTIPARSTYPVPPTSNQQLHLAGGAGETTWLAAAFDVPGLIDEEALEISFEEWTARHDALSCSFSLTDRPGAPPALRLDVADVTEQQLRQEPVVEAHTPEDVRRLLGERMDRACNPFHFPAYFLGAISRADQSTVICGFDHAICDGWSMSIAITELNYLYRRHAAAIDDPSPTDPLPEPGSFLNYCFRESATADPDPADPRIAGWRSFLRACGGDTPHFPLDLELPPGTMSAQGTDTRILLDAHEAERFDANCADNRHSSFGGALAAIALATTQLTGTRDTRLLFPVHTRREPRHNHTFGWLVANAPITVTTHKRFHDTARSVNLSFHEALSLSTLSSAQVLRALSGEVSPTRRNIFSVSYADYRGMPGGSQAQGSLSRPINPRQLSRVSIADDVQFWFSRSHEGLALRTRFPASATSTVNKYLDAVVAAVHEVR